MPRLEACSYFPNTSPSILGNIYQSDGQPNHEQVYVYIASTDSNISLGKGDPVMRWDYAIADGSYKFNNLLEGSYYIWAEDTHPYSSKRLFSNSVTLVTVSKDRKPSYADIKLVTSGSISGLFVDQNGNPLTNATSNVTVKLKSDFIFYYNSIQVAADGTYSFNALMPGTYHIAITSLKEIAAGFTTTFESLPDDTIEIESGKENVHNIYLKLTRVKTEP
jgi:hypothetical protein